MSARTKGPKKRTLSPAQKDALKELRVLKGGEQAAVLKEHLVSTRKNKKTVVAALKEKASTVPELAGATGLPARQVLWLVAGLRKYGEVAEAGLDGDYPRYRLTEEA